MPSQPAAFMSYARFNDQHDDGQLSHFRERLSAEVRVQTGEEFPIFQDRNDIAWGQAWQQRIDETIDAVTLLLVIITPSFFRSPACRNELERFLERERQLVREDLILPVYYVSTPELDDPESRSHDELANVLASRQFADWRELRFEPFTTPIVRRNLAQLAARMRESFWHLPSDSNTPVSGRAIQESPNGRSDAGISIKPRAKTDPPTHIVDPYLRGDFANVADAIAAANPGDRILVRPGSYEGSLNIDKPLEILGDGLLADIQVHAREEEVILFQANIGRISNLTIRQIGPLYQEDGQEEWVDAVAISQGHLELEGCDISSVYGSGVVITDGADPRLRGNRVHDCGADGVSIFSSALGILEDNEIVNNGDDGLFLRDGSNPTIRRNHISRNANSGIHVGYKGLGIFEANDIDSNGGVGFKVDGGSPAARQNVISSNNGGISCRNSAGIFEENRVSESVISGVFLGKGTTGLRRNNIHHNRQSGIVCNDDYTGTIEDNEICDNGSHGVYVTQGTPVLLRNHINRNVGYGVRVLKKGSGDFRHNNLGDNKLLSWNINKDRMESITFEYNTPNPESETHAAD